MVSDDNRYFSVTLWPFKYKYEFIYIFLLTHKSKQFDWDNKRKIKRNFRARRVPRDWSHDLHERGHMTNTEVLPQAVNATQTEPLGSLLLFACFISRAMWTTQLGLWLRAGTRVLGLSAGCCVCLSGFYPDVLRSLWVWTGNGVCQTPTVPCHWLLRCPDVSTRLCSGRDSSR